MADRCGPHPETRLMPQGQCCDNHHARPAVARVLVQSDDTGKVYADLCAVCYHQFQADRQLDELAAYLASNFQAPGPVIIH